MIYLSANGTNLAGINFFPSWQPKTIYLGAGTQTLKWTVSASSQFGIPYPANVDEVSYTSGSTCPIITAHPASQSHARGGNPNFTVTAGGTPPLSYQWQLNGTAIDGATTSSWTITNLDAANLGNYSVVVTNTVGSLISSNAPLEFGDIAGWGSPGYGDITIPIGATNLLAISSGAYWNAALKQDRTFSTWGNSVNGETPIPTNITDVIALAAGDHYGLALRSNGTVAAWGVNYSGETNIPGGLSNVVAIAAASSHSMALRADGTVVAWGSGSKTNVPLDLTNAVAIAAGGVFSTALKADGTVVQWGAGPVPAGLTNVIAIAAGASHTVALGTNGRVSAWGDNSYGQSTVPAGLSNVVAVSAGAFHSVALLANGKVVAWGHSTLGQTNVPIGLTNVISISAGAFHNLALVGTGLPVMAASIAHPGFSSTGFNLRIPSQSGRVYALQYKNIETDPEWISLPLTAGNGANLILTDPSVTNSQRLYRVLRW